MWQAPNLKVKAAANARKKEQNRNKRPIHIKRIVAHIEILEDPPISNKIPARLILNDLTTHGVGLFIPESLEQGQVIKIYIGAPLTITLKATVLSSQEHTCNSHIISAEPFAFRIEAEFEKTDPEVESSIKSFYENICKNYLFSK